MKINSIYVENFRSIKDALEIEFPKIRHLILLVGPNAAGKTNILDAIRYLDYKSEKIPITEASSNSAKHKAINIGFRFLENTLEPSDSSFFSWVFRNTNVAKWKNSSSSSCLIRKITWYENDTIDPFDYKPVSGYRLTPMGYSDVIETIKSKINDIITKHNLKYLGFIRGINNEEILQSLMRLKQRVGSEYTSKPKREISILIEYAYEYGNIIKNHFPSVLTFSFEMYNQFIEKVLYDKSNKSNKFVSCLFEAFGLDFQDLINNKGKIDNIHQLVFKRKPELEKFLSEYWPSVDSQPIFSFYENEMYINIKERESLYPISKRSTGEKWLGLAS